MILFTSDVSARGMDYPDVTRIVQESTHYFTIISYSEVAQDTRREFLDLNVKI